MTACNSTSADGQSARFNSDAPVFNSNFNSDADQATSRPKIIAFGDSLTAGYGLAQNDSYPSLLQEKLDAAGYSYEVINAGVSGDTSAQGLARLAWTLGEKEESRDVRIMILELGANDILRGKPVAQMRENLARIIEEAQARDIKVLLCGMLSPTNTGEAYQREIVSAYKSLADEYNVELLPFFLEGVALNPELNLADGAHPNARGTRIIADTVYRTLTSMLEQDRAASK